jgi:hypothetical protein
MGRQIVQVVEVIDADTPVEAGAEALGGLGRVLGDVAGHLVSRQLPRLVVSGDVADVELLTPAAIPARPSIVQGRTGHPDCGNCLPECLLEQARRERIRWWGQAARAATLGGRVQANNRMEVDRPTSLELGHLRIRDPHQPAQLGLAQTDQPGQGTLDGDGGPPPQLRSERVPQHLRLAVVAGHTQRLPQPRIVIVMAMPAASPHAVGTAGTLAVGVAGQH